MTKAENKARCWVNAQSVTPRVGGIYPPPFAEPLAGREKRALGDAVGITQFGVNLTTLRPGAWSSQRHWHENEDEFVYVLKGEITLVTDEGETLLRPGMAAGFPAGKPDGHHLVNHTDEDALYLEVGTRAPTEVAHYSDIDLAGRKEDGRFVFTHKNGDPCR
jgi:uncharacterized cupin superfamily protein